MFKACIYCGDTTKPRTAEHVLQQAFGTNLVLKEDVCGDCNTVVFSPLDTHLVDYVRKVSHAGHPDLTVERTLLDGLFVCLDEASGVWQSVRLDQRQSKPIVLSQFVMLDDGMRFVCDKSQGEDSYKTVLAELSAPVELSMKEVLVPGETPPVQPAIAKTGKLKYLLRAADEAGLERLRAALNDGTFSRLSVKSGPTHGSTEAPWLKGEIQFSIGDIERATAKAAVNFVCFALPQLVRLSGMAGIRKFALEPYSEEHTGYVFMDNRLPHLVTAGRHTMVLASISKGEHVVVIALYGEPFAVVKLASDDGQPFGPGAEEFAVCEFDYKSRTHTLLLDTDAVRWMMARTPVAG
ncbi:MAG: hypothetical protein HOO96_38675 [Polyangiaceae bacterium]|nr:hypothetical protein [Polyangiaceae bacterium]